MTKTGFSANTMKKLLAALCLLLIVSLGFNVHYFNAAKSDRKNSVYMYKYYMEMHANTFANALVSTGGQEIREFIKNPNQLSGIIEGIELAEFQYMVASNYVPPEELKNKSLSITQSQTLMNGYLYELRLYRSYLYSNHQTPYNQLDQIYTDIDDLLTISKWIHENTEFRVYSDQDFYREVYPRLQSDLKTYFFR